MSGALAWWLAREMYPTFSALRLDVDALARLRRRRLAATLRAAFDAPYWAERLRARGIASDDRRIKACPEAALLTVPPVDKAELQQAGTGVVTGGHIRNGWRCSSSSGTTGQPLRVYFDERAWAIQKLLVKLRARHGCGARITDRVAVLAALHQPGSPTRRSGRPTRLRMLDLARPADALADDLLAFGPSVIQGPPSVLLEVTGALAAAGRRLHPRLVFTGGELLQPTARRALAAAFGCPVLDVYGTAETKEIAWECRAGGRHVNADVLLVEILDRDGHPMPAGEEGDIVVTTLVNAAMPLLRYRTGDRGALASGLCRCGTALPLMGVVAGRESDVVELGDGRRLSPYALDCAVEEVAGLFRYQVTQLEPSAFRVRAVPAPGTDGGSVRDGIARSIQARLGASVGVTVELVDRLGDRDSGKFRVVETLPRMAGAPVR